MGGACTFCRIASDFLSYSELFNNRTKKRHITHLSHCLFLSFLDYNVLKLLLEIYDMQNTTTSEKRIPCAISYSDTIVLTIIQSIPFWTLIPLSVLIVNQIFSAYCGFVIFVISFEFSKIAFLYRKFGDYGYSAIWHCHAL